MEIKSFYNSRLDEKMLYTVHDSGLRVYVFPKKGFSKYYAVYGTEYGSVDRCFKTSKEEEVTEIPDGTAHYLEHKMFEEENGVNAFDMFAQTGASSNAFTSFDLTAYLFSCTDKFYENLDILLGFVNRPCFTEENVQKEQGIIGQEIKMYDDDPEWRVFFNALTAMYHNNPVKTDIAGTVESISHITPQVLYKCYDTFYNPSNMILVMVGDIDIKEAMKYVDKHVAASKNTDKPERFYQAEPKERVRERTEQKLMVSQPLFRIGFKDNQIGLSAAETLKNEIATEIILEALFGKTGDLYMQLYAEGLINNTFDAETETSATYGFTLIGGESENPDAVYERIKARLVKAQKEGIPDEDLKRAEKVMISGNIKVFNSVERMGNSFIRQLISGYNPLEFQAAAESVTKEDIIKRLNEHFDVNNCVLSVVKPIE